ncbi:MAG: L-aspartate oxidase [Candidatus Magasanikiibacteriota bacterium]
MQKIQQTVRKKSVVVKKIPRRSTPRNEYSFLVIGSGIAGLNFALQAAKHGKVAIVTKKELAESNTNYAQGGIASVLSKTDNFKKHIADTLKAGCFLNDKKAVETMIKQGPKEIKRLLKLGVGFSKAENKLCLTREGGHSERRIAHVNDTTGKEIERALIHQVRHNGNIKIFESHLAFKLLTENQESVISDQKNKTKKRRSQITDHCIGALVLDIENNKIKTFQSKATILATGGAGQVYLRNSNPKIATGDGIALAYEIGAEIKDLEFIQFHPTALDKKNKPAFLLSESLRGEGALLVNTKSQKFMHKYDKLKELAPRDIVSRAIFNEAKKGQTYLDIRHKGTEYIKQRFPYIYNELWWYGIKMDKDLIPVSPAAHFICGGVHTDLNGQTNIPGLFAFGEVAHTGVHGANRLASNSLLEAMVFSSRAINSTKNYVKKYSTFNIQHSTHNTYHITHTNNTTVKKIKHSIQELMWQNVGIVRKPKKLLETIEILSGYYQKINQIFAKGVNKDIIELKNLCTVAILITKSALERKKSVGCHYIK